jgi:hypothetical protein
MVVCVKLSLEDEKMKKNKGFTVIEVLLLLLFSSIMLLALMPIMTKKSVNTAINTNVIQCIVKENAGDLSSSACNAAVNGGVSNAQNYFDSIVMYLDGDNATYSSAALKVIGSICDNGGTLACDRIIDRCVKDSTQCNNGTNYDLDYYLKLSSSDVNEGRNYIVSMLPSYYNFGLTNIVSQVNSACCSTDVLNAACTIKTKMMCPRKLGLDTTYYDYSYGSAMDSSGNIYLVGTISTSTTASTKNISVMKLNSSLVVQWAKTFGSAAAEDNGYGITVDPSGNVYIVGTIKDDSTSAEIQAAMFNNSGTIQWQKSYKKTSTDIDGIGIALTPDNLSLNVVGKIDNGSNDDILFLNLVASTGAIRTQRSYRYWGEDRGYDLKVDSTGNVYITGLAGTSATTGNDLIVLKTDTFGNTLANKWYSSSGNSTDFGYGMALGNEGNLYVTGCATTSGTTYHLPVISINASTLAENWRKVYISATTDEFGNVMDEYGFRISQDPYNNLLVTGYRKPDTVSSGCQLYERAYAMKLSSKNGSIIWQKNMYPNGARDTEIHGIYFPDKYSILFTGGFLPQHANYFSGCTGTDPNHNYRVMALKLDTVQTTGNLFNVSTWAGSTGTPTTYGTSSLTLTETATAYTITDITSTYTIDPTNPIIDIN